MATFTLATTGTFTLTGEHIMDPPKEVVEGLAEAGLAAGSFVTLKHGETRVFDLLRKEAADAPVSIDAYAV
jgi:hypothetical protein